MSLSLVHSIYVPGSDIFIQDGVLIRGPNALPAAKRALTLLDGHNRFGVYVFLNRYAATF